jgi:hypothetical protein
MDGTWLLLLLLMMVGFPMLVLVLLMVLLMVLLLHVLMLVGGRLLVFVGRGLQVVGLLNVVLLRVWVLVLVGGRLLPLVVVVAVLEQPSVLVRGQLLLFVMMGKEKVVLLSGAFCTYWCWLAIGRCYQYS